jgi:hypothetical protein
MMFSETHQIALNGRVELLPGHGRAHQAGGHADEQSADDEDGNCAQYLEPEGNQDGLSLIDPA